MAKKPEPTAMVLVSQELKDAAVDIRRAAALPAERWPDERIRTIARTVAPPDTSLSELAMFLSVCERYELDPIVGEAWLVKDERTGKVTVLTGRDSMQKVASRDPGYEGVEFGVIYEADEYTVIREGEKLEVHSKGVGFDRGRIVGAWCIGRRKGIRPVFVERRWSDYAHLHGKKNWKQDPQGMIETRVITAALRRMYTMAGLYTTAELDDIMGDETAALEGKTRASLEGLKARMAESAPVPEGAKKALARFKGEEVATVEAATVEDSAEPETEAVKFPVSDSDPGNGIKGVRSAYFATIKSVVPDWGDVERKLWQEQHGFPPSCKDWTHGDYQRALEILDRRDLDVTLPSDPWPAERGLPI